MILPPNRWAFQRSELDGLIATGLDLNKASRTTDFKCLRPIMSGERQIERDNHELLP